MSRLLAKLWFVIGKRMQGSRISLACYIKNPVQIHLGTGVKVHGSSTLDASAGGHITLGNNVTLNRYAYVTASRAGVQIGAYSELNHFVVINGAGGVSIGKHVLIGPTAQLISYQHSYQAADLPIAKQDYIYKPIVIENDVWIGAGALILAGVTIGQGSVVGAGAVVTKSCEPYSVLMGVPARVVKTRGS